MTINLNGNLIEMKDQINLIEFLDIQGFESKNGIAVAINQKVIQKQNWETKSLQHNDHVLIIQATQGG